MIEKKRKFFCIMKVLLALAALAVAFFVIQSRGKKFSSVVFQSIEYIARPHSGPSFEPIVSRAAWYGSKLHQGDYLINISAHDQETLTRAVKNIPVNKTLGELTKDDLTLPPLLEQVISGSTWRDHLANGLGFVAIRGIPTQNWSVEEARRFFWIFGLKIGRPGLQDSASDSYLTDIRDTKSNNPQTDRQYKTNAAQNYHVDMADVVGLLCLQTAGKGGGISRLISSVTIFNELLKTPNGKRHAARLYNSGSFS